MLYILLFALLTYRCQHMVIFLHDFFMKQISRFLIDGMHNILIFSIWHTFAGHCNKKSAFMFYHFNIMHCKTFIQNHGYNRFHFSFFCHFSYFYFCNLQICHRLMLLLSDDKNIKFLSLLACADLCSICQAVFWSINKDSNSSV